MNQQVEVLHMGKRQSQAVAPGGLEREYKREMPKEKQPNVDSSRTPLNRYITRGPKLQTQERPGTLNERIQERIHSAQGDKTVRKDAVVDMEFLLSGSHDNFEKMTPQQIEDWAQDSYQFMADTFGEENIVEAVLHLDETTPHIHVHVVPIVTNKDGTQKLCAKKLTSKGQLSQYHTEYAKRIEKYGFQRSSEGSRARHRDPKEYYREVNQKVAAEERKLQTKAEIPKGELPALKPEDMSGTLKESIGRQQVFGGQQQREGIALDAAAQQRQMDQQAIDKLSRSYSYTLAGAEKKIEQKDTALKEMTAHRDAWFKVSTVQSQRLDQFYAKEIAANPAAEAPAKAEVLDFGFSDSYIKNNFPQLFEGEIQLKDTVPWAGQFSIERLIEVTKPNKPEPIDDTVQTIRGVPVNTGFLTCADSPEAYKRKLDWKKLDDSERQGIIQKVFDYFRNLARSIVDRLQQMLNHGRVDVKEAIWELRPDGRSLTKADAVRDMTTERQLSRGLRL